MPCSSRHPLRYIEKEHVQVCLCFSRAIFEILGFDSDLVQSYDIISNFD